MFKSWIRNFCIMTALGIGIGVFGIGAVHALIWLAKELSPNIAGPAFGIVLMVIAALGVTLLERRA